MTGEKVDRLFKEADTSGDGRISEDEVKKLIKEHFGVELSEEELTEAISQMDSKKPTPGTGTAVVEANKLSETAGQVEIDQDEFQQWWYLQKHGRPPIDPCPREMLNFFANHMQTQCVSPQVSSRLSHVCLTDSCPMVRSRLDRSRLDRSRLGRSRFRLSQDRIVRKGEYGDNLYILSGGTVEIWDHGLRPEGQQDQHERDDRANDGEGQWDGVRSFRLFL